MVQKKNAIFVRGDIAHYNIFFFKLKTKTLVLHSCYHKNSQLKGARGLLKNYDMNIE